MVAPVSDRHRLTIRTVEPDPRASQLIAGADMLGLPDPGAVAVADVVHLCGTLSADELRQLHGVLVDPLLQTGTWDTPNGRAVEVSLLPGVTDPGADAVHHAAEQLGLDIEFAATGLRLEFDARIADADIDALVSRLVANPIIERWQHGLSEPHAPGDDEGADRAATVRLRGADDLALAAIDAERSLSLDPAELVTIRDHFEALGRDPTDAELETLAQTWSEHCAHKTFRAVITAEGEDGSVERTPLLAQLRACTEEIDAPFVRSAFVGNAGVVEFAKGTTIALKAETHNHPSAVEPFGGANTGVGGVIRDVLGIAHRPIAVTDVLCFGPADTRLDQLPAGALHPQRIADGVIDGVADYGNKIGLPTVAGAVLYDPGYTTNTNGFVV